MLQKQKISKIKKKKVPPPQVIHPIISLMTITHPGVGNKYSHSSYRKCEDTQWQIPHLRLYSKKSYNLQYFIKLFILVIKTWTQVILVTLEKAPCSRASSNHPFLPSPLRGAPFFFGVTYENRVVGTLTEKRKQRRMLLTLFILETSHTCRHSEGKHSICGPCAPHTPHTLRPAHPGFQACLLCWRFLRIEGL